MEGLDQPVGGFPPSLFGVAFILLLLLQVGHWVSLFVMHRDGFSWECRLQSLYYSLLKEQLNISVRSLPKRPKTVEGRKKKTNLTRSKKDSTKRICPNREQAQKIRYHYSFAHHPTIPGIYLLLTIFFFSILPIN